MKKGIDVSQWQGTIYWDKVIQTDIEFAILRTGYGKENISQIDTRFYEYLNGCKNVGMPTGAYHYGYAKSEDEARQEAEFCLSIIDNADMPYCVWYDVEEQSMFDLGADKLTKIINSFCEVIENAGYKAGLYMSCYAAQNYIDILNVRYYKWIADYGSICDLPVYYDMWQYSSTAQIDGIADNTVDVDYCYTDFESSDTTKSYEWIWYTQEKKWAVKENGQWVYDRWIYDTDSENKGWYRIDNNGWLIRQGWYKEGDNWYYLDLQTGKMYTGWFFDNNDNFWYYFELSGKMTTDKWIWDTKTQGWYYLKSSGVMAKSEFVSAPGEKSKYWTDESGKWIR